MPFGSPATARLPLPLEIRPWPPPRITVLRFASTIAVELPIALGLLYAGFGVIALVVLALITAFAARIPYRCRLTPAGLELSWAVFTHRLPFETIASVDVVPDPRRCVVGRRMPALVVRRRGAPPLLLFANLAALDALRAGIRSEIAVLSAAP